MATVKKALFFALVLVGISLSGSTPTAIAHAFLVSSDPANGAELQESPDAVVLTFSEGVSPLPGANAVRDIAGKRVDSRDITADGPELRIAVPKLDDGSYLVNWGVTSADGHPVRGTILFAVGEKLNPSVRDVAPALSSGWASHAATLARGAGYLATTLAIGFTVFALVVAGAERRGSLRWAGWSGAATVVTAGLVLGAETLRLVDGDWSALNKMETWDAAWNARYLPGAMLTVAGGIAVGSLMVQSGQRWSRGAGTVGVVLIAVGLAWTGHPAAINPQWFGIGANTVHVLAIGSWFGGLVALGLSVRRLEAAESASIARRFSRFATVLFPVAVVSGIVLAWRVVPGWSEIVETGYGRLLIGKVALVSIAGLAALANRQRVVPALVHNPESDRRKLLGRLLAVEIVALVVAIGLTASLTGRPPETAAGAASAGRPFSTDVFLEPYHVVVSIDPGRAGTNRLAVDLHELVAGTGQPPSVDARFSFGASRSGPTSYSLEHVDGPRWETDVSLQQTGNWTMTLVVELSDSSKVQLELTVPIGR